MELSKPGSWGQRLKDKYLLRDRVSAKVKNTCILRLYVPKSKVLLQVFQCIYWIQPERKSPQPMRETSTTVSTFIKSQV